MKKSLATTLIIAYSLVFLTPFAKAEAELPSQVIETNHENQKYYPNRNDAEFAQRSAVSERWTFKEIPRDLGLSMKESFWGWGSLAFGLGLGTTAAFYPLDDDVKNKLGPNEIFGDTGNDVIGWVLSPYSLGGVSAILWIVGHNTKHEKLSVTGRALTEAMALSLGVTMVGKFAFRRHRPNGGRFAFPSAHSTAAFSAAGVLTVLYGWKGGIPSYALASLVSLSRLDAHKHWLTDVLAGAVIGSIIGIGTAKFHKKENANLFFVPNINGKNVSLNVHYRF